MNTTQPTILLVDDIPENLRLLAEMLKKSGYSPRPVLSGAAAFKLLERQPVDLILLDINIADRLFDRHKAMFLLLSQKSFTRHL